MAIPFDVCNTLVVVLLSVAATTIVVPLVALVRCYLWEPLRIQRIMAKQGIVGPPFRIIFGSLPELAAYANSFPESMPLDNGYYDMLPTVKPQFNLYFARYGKSFLYWRGPQAKLVVRDPDIAREVLVSKCGFFERPPDDIRIFSLFVGVGLDNLTGEKWAIERRTLNRFFYQDVLKGMVDGIIRGAVSEMQKWEEAVSRAGGTFEIDVEQEMHIIAGNIISYTTFSTDYEKGVQIYQSQTKYVKLLYESLHSGAYWIPGFSFLRTRKNRRMRQLKSKFDKLLHEMITSRHNAVQSGEKSSYGDDLLGFMLEAASEGKDETATEFNLASVFNNTKLFFFAGQDTVANVLTFTLLQLARHPEWQKRARKEVLEVVGESEAFDFDLLPQLKIVGMVLNESMRVFSVVSSISKAATKDIQVLGLFIPKGLVLEIPVAALHQDPEYWGEDVHKFNPERFAFGVSNACTHPQAFIPFSVGPRTCIGKDFAMMEAKFVLCMILRRFQLLMSPNYKHHPIETLLTRPKYGLQLILESLLSPTPQ